RVPTAELVVERNHLPAAIHTPHKREPPRIGPYEMSSEIGCGSACELARTHFAREEGQLHPFRHLDDTIERPAISLPPVDPHLAIDDEGEPGLAATPNDLARHHC